MSYMYPPGSDAGGGMPMAYRAPSPSPFGMQSPQMPQMGPGMPASGGIQPGAMTYTTSIGPDGNPIYHMFRAELATYRGPQGLVQGTQWRAVDSPQYDEPADAMPASIDWIHQYAQNRTDPREEKMWKEWIKMEEKRRKREEKQYAKQQKELEKEQRAQEKEYEREVRRGGRRSRAGSFSAPYDTSPNMQGYADPGQMMTAGNYLTASTEPMSLSRQRRLSQSGGSPANTAAALDMERRMRDMDLNDRSRGVRRRSVNFSDPEPQRERRSSFNSYERERPVGLAEQRYGAYQPTDVVAPRPSYMQAGADDYPGFRNQLSADGGGAYPPGHILSYAGGAGGGQPIPITDRRKSPNYAYSELSGAGTVPITDRPRSPNYYAAGRRSPQPPVQVLDRPRTPNYSYSGVTGPGYLDNPGALTSQRYGTGHVQPPPAHMPVQQHQMMFPDAFNRLPTFSGQGLLESFEPFLVAILDSIGVEMPRLPAVLVSREVTHHDWIRFMTDLTSAWFGDTQQYAAFSGGRAPRKSAVTASLIDSWNSAYFLERRIELVLVKGKTRFSGPGAGRTEPRLSRAIEAALTDDFSDSDSDTLSELDDEYDDFDSDRGGRQGGYGYNTGFGFYGSGSGSNYRLPGDDRWMSDASMARRRWIERKRAEKRQEKKMSHRREKARRERSLRKKYSLYLMSTV